MTARGNSLRCSRNPGSNLNAGLIAPTEYRPRCRRRGHRMAKFHALQVRQGPMENLNAAATSDLPMLAATRRAWSQVNSLAPSGVPPSSETLAERLTLRAPPGSYFGKRGAGVALPAGSNGPGRPARALPAIARFEQLARRAADPQMLEHSNLRLTRATCVGCHRPPLGAGTPRQLLGGRPYRQRRHGLKHATRLAGALVCRLACRRGTRLPPPQVFP